MSTSRGAPRLVDASRKCLLAGIYFAPASLYDNPISPLTQTTGGHMLRTPFCGLIGIDVPIVQAPAAPYTTPELVSAVSNTGGLGSYATGLRQLDRVMQDVNRIRELTDRPFAINFVMRAFDPDAFAFVMADPPPVVSFAAGIPETLIGQSHDAGSLVFVQIHTVEQARRAAAQGVDAIVAQGTEAGGLTGTVSLMPLLPQVVDAVGPIPVIAAGGIADGRGLAAALVLGAQGVNVGTRFLASEEAALNVTYRERLLQARSEDTLRATILDNVFPPPDESLPLTSRSLRTEFLDEWERSEPLEPGEIDRARSELIEAAESGRIDAYVAGAGQSVGLVNDVLPAAEIVQRIASEAEGALARAGSLVAPPA